MSSPHEDRELEAWLQRSSAMHDRLAQLDRSDPPEDIDRRVLSYARQALQRRFDAARATRWAVPAGLAASLVISFAILLRLGPTSLTTEPEPLAQEASSDSDAAMAARTETPPQRALADHAATERVRPDVAVSARVKAEDAVASNSAAYDSSSVAETRTDPKAWLAVIEQLRAQGRTLEAERELAAFQRAYPQGAPASAAATAPEER